MCFFGWQEAVENLWGYSYFWLRLSATTPLENKKVFSEDLEHAWKHENKSENHNRENTSSNLQLKPSAGFRDFCRQLGVFEKQFCSPWFLEGWSMLQRALIWQAHLSVLEVWVVFWVAGADDMRLG